MQFLHSGFFWAFAALAIPVILHLFHFRQTRKVYFPSIRFLKRVEQESRNIKNLKKRLILLSRLLFLSFLALAFTMPYFSSNEKGSQVARKFYSVYVDNSASMLLKGSEGEHLQFARQRAVEFVRSCNETSLFQIITNDLTGAEQKILQRDEAIERLDGISPGLFNADWDELLSRQKEALSRAGEVDPTFLYFSDFQKSPNGPTVLAQDSQIKKFLFPAALSEVSNISIDSAATSAPVMAPGVPFEVIIWVSVSGKEGVESGSLALEIDGKPKGVAGFSCAPGGRTQVRFSLTIDEPGYHKGVASVVDPNIPLDNQFYFTLEMAGNIGIAHIGSGVNNPSTSKVFSLEKAVRMTTMNDRQMDFGQIRKLNYLIIEPSHPFSQGEMNELRQFAEGGGSILFIPPSDPQNWGSWISWFTSLGLAINPTPIVPSKKLEAQLAEHPFWTDVLEKSNRNTSQPGVIKYYSMQAGSQGFFVPLMKLEQGIPFLSTATLGKGRIYLMSTSLDRTWTDFMDHGFFLPFLLKSAFLSKPAFPLFARLGSNSPVSVWPTQQGTSSAIELEKEKIKAIPDASREGNQVKLYIPKELKSPGHYMLNGVGAPAPVLALNFPQGEGNMVFYQEDELSKIIGNYGQLIKNKGLNMSASLGGQQGVWIWMVIVSLIFLLAEMVIIRFFAQDGR